MTDINNLIHLNLELEGLLRVLAERNSIHAKSLLAQKYREYAAQLEAFLAEPSEEVARQLEETASNLAAEATHTEVKDQEAESAEVIDETDAATAAIERGVEEAPAQAAAELQEIEEPEQHPEPAVDPEPAVEQAPVHTADPIAVAAAQAAPIAHVPNQKILKAFTLNDKFRFRRELFGGDDRAFEDTLAILADMPSYDDACDFIYNDMMLDEKNPDVADFMAVLKECYK
ncbi:MAG: hypothetical protein K2K69_01580 [Muribaculaceae bacterium]|nr:hypothetical protein [Muribaculaceae bacterium]